MKIDWKRKLTSRKFWAMLAGFITGLVIYVNSPEKSPEALAGVIMAGGSLMSYIFGEGIADKGNNAIQVLPEQIDEGSKEGVDADA